MTTVNIYEAKTQLSRLLAAVDSGEEVVIARRGEPRWRLSLIGDEAPRRTRGAWAGRVEFADDWKSWSPEEDHDWYGDDDSPAA
ncbi:MAG: type II toxin-antitoxin system prevent-host-death family antitoxin [Leifsonia xyli]|nr:MAG: type II toxin-antitoxin system prevent-host-death family antitoxin [Leifsonia xyli]